MKHTQGKWYVSEHEDNQDVVIRIEENKFQIIANCEIDFVRHDKATYEILANAYLIAAAPDLLDACKAQEEADSWFGSSSTGRKLKNKAKELRQAAITKIKL